MEVPIERDVRVGRGVPRNFEEPHGSLVVEALEDRGSGLACRSEASLGCATLNTAFVVHGACTQLLDRSQRSAVQGLGDVLVDLARSFDVGAGDEELARTVMNETMAVSIA